MQFQNLYRRFVFDSTKLPINWETNPHDAYKILSRLFFAFVGSIVPFGMILIYSKVLGKIEEGIERIGLEFVVVGVVFLTVWFISIVLAASSEEKSVLKHMLLGSIGPANLALVLRIIQPDSG